MMSNRVSILSITEVDNFAKGVSYTDVVLGAFCLDLLRPEEFLNAVIKFSFIGCGLVVRQSYFV